MYAITKSDEEGRLFSYGTKTITTVTTSTRSIRFMYANTPAGGSVFKLQHQDHHHRQHLHQAYQIHVCKHSRQRLRFQVTAPRSSPLSPPSPGLSDSCMQTPPPEAPFSSYSTKIITTVTPFTRSVRFMHTSTPAGGSVFKLRHQDHHRQHLHQAYQIYMNTEHPHQRQTH